ncbi:MAG: DUF4252 domain-containing protein [Flavobacteriales bacterium]|nr:DUF4252 domain-containing protein [Flavobacteriales bacterium]
MKKSILTIVCGLLLGGALMAQSRTVDEFQRTADGYDLYLYQSVIRMLNKDKDPDFNMLIRSLDHLKLVTTSDLGDRSSTRFKKLDSDIVKENFEEVMALDSRESKCHLYEKNGTWIATFHFSGFAGVFEMKGELDLAYVKALNSLDMDRLKEMLPLDEIEEDLEEEE